MGVTAKPVSLWYVRKETMSGIKVIEQFSGAHNDDGAAVLPVSDLAVSDWIITRVEKGFFAQDIEPTVHEVSSLVWYKIVLGTENILSTFRNGMPIGSKCDEISYLIYDQISKLEENSSDFQMLTHIQTHVNEARLLEGKDKKKVEERLIHALELANAAEDATRSAEDLGLSAVSEKQIDEIDGRPVFTV